MTAESAVTKIAFAILLCLNADIIPFPACSFKPRKFRILLNKPFFAAVSSSSSSEVFSPSSSLPATISGSSLPATISGSSLPATISGSSLPATISMSLPPSPSPSFPVTFSVSLPAFSASAASSLSINSWSLSVALL